MNIKNTLFFLILLILFSQRSWAFLNVEELRKPGNLGHFYTLGAKFSGALGNTDKFNSSASSTYLYQNKSHEWILSGNYYYGQATQVENLHKGHGHLRWAYTLAPHWVWESFLQTQFDKFKKLNQRHLLGQGVRWLLYQNKSSYLHFGAGGFLEREHYESLQKENSFRGNFYLSYKVNLSSKSKLSVSGYYQPLLKNQDDVRLRGRGALRFYFSPRFFVSMELHYAYDGDVPSGVKKGDLIYLTGLNFKVGA